MITSATNEKIKFLKKLLRDKKTRRESGLFVIEGEKMVAEAAAGDVAEVFVSEEFSGAYTGDAAAKGDIPVHIVSQELFLRIGDTVHPQGVMAIVKIPAWDVEEVLSRPDPLFVLVEDLQDPGNAGTILRSAEAAGADAVWFAGNSVDCWNPKCVRATMGAALRVPVFFADTARDIVEEWNRRGIRTYAASLEGSIPYDQAEYTKGTALVIGSEAHGLSMEAVDACAGSICIPMEGSAESLNAAVAASVLMFEAQRQRRQNR